MRPWQDIAYHLPGRMARDEAPGHDKGGRHGFHRHDDSGGKDRLPALFDVADEADANEADRLDMGQPGAEGIRHGNGLDKAHGGMFPRTRTPVEKSPAPDALPTKYDGVLYFANNRSAKPEIFNIGESTRGSALVAAEKASAA